MPKRDTNSISLDQQEENEICKLRLAASYGAVVTSSNQLPEEIESAWLLRLEEVEKQFVESKKISVASFLDFPTYISEERLSDKKVKLALDQTLEDLSKAGIEITTLYKVPPREMYKYLTEELLWEQIDNVRMQGINHQFVYEEFFQNEEFEIEHTIVEFFDMLFGKYYSMLESIIYVDEDELGDNPEQASMVDRLCDFADAFDQIELNEFRLLKINVEDDEGSVTAHINFTGHPNSKGKGFTFEGPCHFKLKLDKYDSWTISYCEIPGAYMPNVPKQG
jgi:hypothetical protein